MSKTRVELGGMSANIKSVKNSNFRPRRPDVSPTRRSSSSPIAELGRDDELPLPADLHPQDSNVPALDDLPGPQLELERLAVLEAVKLLVVGLQSSLTEVI